MAQVFSRFRIAVFAIALAAGIGIAAGVQWVRGDGSEESGERIDAASQAKAAELLADIKRFRAEAGAMEAGRAAQAWLALYDRAAKLGTAGWRGDYSVFDAETSNVVGLQSMLAALPGPQAWAALHEGAKARVERAPGDVQALALRFVTEVLTAEVKAAAATLGEVERAAAKSASKERDTVRAQAAYLRAELARLYGSREEIAATFVASLEAQARHEHGEIDVPDLVGLVGEAKANALLREALAKPVRLHVPEGSQTRAAARKAALELVASLPVPQWGLVDGMEGAQLYEALERRFSGIATKGARDGFRKAEADVYYFLHLVVKGRHAEAEKALGAVAGANALHIPKRSVEALQRAGHNEALFRFLHSLLARRPELRAWEVYTREAAYTGHSAEVLARVEGLLARKDLADGVRADLRFHRANALLAADKVEPALAELRALLAAPPQEKERTLQLRTDAALRLAGLGRVLERRDLAEHGLSFARAALAAEREGSWRRERLLKEVFAEHRKHGLLEEAGALAAAELQREAGSAKEPERYGFGGPFAARAAAIELASLHGEAKRFREVVGLLDDSSQWSARDLSELLAEKDSLGVPLALTAARALAHTGNGAAALALARSLIDALPGHDPAYELLAGLDPQASAYLDKVYARDQFEERPLIWKATLLSRQGRTLEAESLVRRAIVIDPSDGEEGPKDRMRAYAVLADILETKGAKAPAAQYRKAVQAIRISERSDELHRLGLYRRAFAGYREALAQFADAYCIQSRLAVRLMEQGRREEAFEHYRRAYELMPASFGRVESHCFGCESVFQGPEQQKIAEKVFGELLLKQPKKPQVHYLLGYLHKERGRYPEALKRFHESVRLDAEYLNAWKHLHDLGSQVYVEPRERDLARLKLLELDPRRRHVRYELDSVGDLGALWRAVEAASAVQPPPGEGKTLYPLRASAAMQDRAQAKLPEELRSQMEQHRAFMSSMRDDRVLRLPRQVLARHALIKASVQLMGE